MPDVNLVVEWPVNGISAMYGVHPTNRLLSYIPLICKPSLNVNISVDYSPKINLPISHFQKTT